MLSHASTLPFAPPLQRRPVQSLPPYAPVERPSAAMSALPEPRHGTLGHVPVSPWMQTLLINGVSFLQTTKIIVLTGPIVIVLPFLHTGRKRAPLLPGMEEPMITIEFITALFYEVDEQLGAIPKHPKAHLWPSEVVTLGLL